MENPMSCLAGDDAGRRDGSTDPGFLFFCVMIPAAIITIVFTLLYFRNLEHNEEIARQQRRIDKDYALEQEAEQKRIERAKQPKFTYVDDNSPVSQGDIVIYQLGKPGKDHLVVDSLDGRDIFVESIDGDHAVIVWKIRGELKRLVVPLSCLVKPKKKIQVPTF
jgi:hypothetical protein